jgi:hypothetical protein
MTFVSWPIGSRLGLAPLAPFVMVRLFAPQVVSTWLTTVSLFPCIVRANGPV